MAIDSIFDHGDFECIEDLVEAYEDFLAEGALEAALRAEYMEQEYIRQVNMNYDDETIYDDDDLS